jgi:hypothetical protein
VNKPKNPYRRQRRNDLENFYQTLSSTEGGGEAVSVNKSDYIPVKPVKPGDWIQADNIEVPVDMIVIECKSPSNVTAVCRQNILHNVKIVDGVTPEGTPRAHFKSKLAAHRAAGFDAVEQLELPLSSLQRHYINLNT